MYADSDVDQFVLVPVTNMNVKTVPGIEVCMYALFIRWLNYCCRPITNTATQQLCYAKLVMF